MVAANLAEAGLKFPEFARRRLRGVSNDEQMSEQFYGRNDSQSQSPFIYFRAQPFFCFFNFVQPFRFQAGFGEASS